MMKMSSISKAVALSLVLASASSMATSNEQLIKEAKSIKVIDHASWTVEKRNINPDWIGKYAHKSEYDSKAKPEGSSVGKDAGAIGGLFGIGNIVDTVVDSVSGAGAEVFYYTFNLSDRRGTYVYTSETDLGSFNEGRTTLVENKDGTTTMIVDTSNPNFLQLKQTDKTSGDKKWLAYSPTAMGMFRIERGQIGVQDSSEQLSLVREKGAFKMSIKSQICIDNNKAKRYSSTVEDIAHDNIVFVVNGESVDMAHACVLDESVFTGYDFDEQIKANDKLVIEYPSEGISYNVTSKGYQEASLSEERRDNGTFNKWEKVSNNIAKVDMDFGYLADSDTKITSQFKMWAQVTRSFGKNELSINGVDAGCGQVLRPSMKDSTVTVDGRKIELESSCNGSVHPAGGSLTPVNSADHEYLYNKFITGSKVLITYSNGSYQNFSARGFNDAVRGLK